MFDIEPMINANYANFGHIPYGQSLVSVLLAKNNSLTIFFALDRYYLLRWRQLWNVQKEWSSQI